MSEVCCAPEWAAPIGASTRLEVLARSVNSKKVDLFNGVVSDDPEPGKVWWCHDVLAYYEKHGGDGLKVDVRSVVYPTTWQMTLGTGLLNVPSSKGMVIPYWVDEIKPDTSKFDDPKTCFIWAGRPHHGLGVLHAVLKHLRSVEGRNLRLIAYCNDEWNDHVELMQMIANEEWVEFRGRADNDEVRRAIAQEAHVAALPYTIGAGQPLQLLEGMCGGCVPVVPCYAGLPESVIMDRGIIYHWEPDPAKHAANLARKVDSLLEFRKQSWHGFESLAMSYRQVARMKYDWEVVSGVWQNYTRAISEE
jgi:glycosyltransferase involved in cell wall biosynthesis